MIWLWIGDSITDGMRDYLMEAYANRGEQVVVSAYTGWSTRTWLQHEQQLRNLIEQTKPDVIVFALGTNDVGDGGGRVDDGNITRLLFADKEAKVVWIGPFNSAAENRRLAETVGKRVGFVDGVALAEGVQRAPDGVHFRNYRALAERAVKAVDDAVPSSMLLKVAVGLGAALLLGYLFNIALKE